MKLPGVHIPRSCFTPRRHREDGIAVIVVMALIVLVLIFLMGNIRTFHALGRELKLLDRQQTRRLQVGATNAHVISISNLESHTNSLKPPNTNREIGAD